MIKRLMAGFATFLNAWRRAGGSTRSVAAGQGAWRRWFREGELAAPPALVPAADYLRVVAAIGIVVYHAVGAPAEYIGSTSLGVFLLLSFQQLAQPISLKVFLTRRCLRLVIPWVAWLLIYAVFRIWIEQGLHRLLAKDSIWAVLDWPASHLWYLPFIVVTTAAMLSIRPFVRQVPMGWRWAIGGAVGLLLMTMVPIAATLVPSKPILVYAVPSAGFGLAYSYALRYRGDGRRRRFIAVSVAMASSALIAWAAGLADHVAVAYLLGAVIILFCTVQVPRSAVVMRLSVLTLGVYLAHPLCFRVADKFSVMFALSFEGRISLRLIAGIFGAALLTYLMRRTPYLRAIV